MKSFYLDRYNKRVCLSYRGVFFAFLALLALGALAAVL